MQATVYNLAGEQVDTVELDESIFGVSPNTGVIQQAVLRQQANARQGTHETKTRAYVSGGGRKPWRQKGTGRARQGSTRAPQWRHGGVVFGPHVRSYEQDMPRKMRRLAIRGVLSAKLADGQLVLVDSFADLEPRTKAMKEALASLNVGENSTLIMLAGEEPNLEKAAGNLPRVKTMLAHYFSLVDMLKYDYIVMPRASLDIVNTVLGSTGGRRKFSINRNGATATAEAATEIETPTQTEAEAPQSSVAFAPTAEAAQTAEASVADTAEESTDVTEPRNVTTEAATANPQSAIETPQSDEEVQP